MKDNSFVWIVKNRMAQRHIPNMLELSKASGIGYQTLREHIEEPERMKIHEIRSLHEVLHFSNLELLNLTKGR